MITPIIILFILVAVAGIGFVGLHFANKSAGSLDTKMMLRASIAEETLADIAALSTDMYARGHASSAINRIHDIKKGK